MLFHSTLLFVQQFDACVCVCQYTTIMAWQHKDKTTNMALRMQNRPNLNSKSMVVMQSCAVVKTLVFPITSIIYFRLIRKRNRLYRITKHLTCITRHLRDHMTSNKNMSRDLTCHVLVTPIFKKETKFYFVHLFIILLFFSSTDDVEIYITCVCTRRYRVPCSPAFINE